MREQKNKFLGMLMVLLGLCLFLQNAGIITIDGSIIPLLIGLAFIATYLLGQTWAIIPGSLLSCIGLVIYATSTGMLNPDRYWPLFIFAPSLAFFIMRLLGGSEFKWAIYPGFFIALGGTIATLSAYEYFSARLWHYLNYAGPLALLAFGLILIVRNRKPKDSQYKDPRDPRL